MRYNMFMLQNWQVRKFLNHLISSSVDADLKDQEWRCFYLN